MSARPTREVSEVDRRFQNGTYPQVLDILSVPLLKHEPEAFHVENHVLDDNYYWEKVRRADWNEASKAVDGNAQTLWFNGRSTYNGQNDEIPIQDANSLSSSLLLIQPTNLVLQVAPEGYQTQKRQVRASFQYNGDNYRFKVTDPAIEKKYLAQPDDDYKIENALLSISLSEEFLGFSYKLVAAVITP